MQKDSISELLKDNLIPLHNHQARIQTSEPFYGNWSNLKWKMKRVGDKLQKCFVR